MSQKIKIMDLSTKQHFQRFANSIKVCTDKVKFAVKIDILLACRTIHNVILSAVTLVLLTMAYPSFSHGLVNFCV